MFTKGILNILRTTYRSYRKSSIKKLTSRSPVLFGILTTAHCTDQKKIDLNIDIDTLDHDFLIKQATTVNVNAATQLLTVTIIAITDTSERLRKELSKEICLVRQAMEWGEDITPAQHWDQLVEVKGALCDLNHNLRILFSYMDYVEKLATATAEISYLSGNIAASDAICERIDHATRTCKTQKQLTHDLQQESLELQQEAIISSPTFEARLKDNTDETTK